MGHAGERKAIPSRRYGSAGLKVAHQFGHGARLTPDTYGHVMDELDHAPRLAAVDAIMQARSGPTPERPGLNVSSA